MALNKVSVICDVTDGAGNPLLSGTGCWQPSVAVTDAADHVLVAPSVQLAATFRATGSPSVPLLACDNAALLPAGWRWTWTPPSGSGLAPQDFNVQAGPVAFTATSASPCVFTATAPAGQPWTDGQQVTLSGASLPGGFTAGTAYYLTGVSGSAFSLAATQGGAAAGSTSAGSGDVTVGSVYLSQMSPAATAVTTFPLNPMTAAGDLVYGGASPAGTPERLAGNTAATREFLVSQGTGSAAQAPAWAGLQSGDLPVSPALTGTPTAPTAAPGTDTTQLATTAFVAGAVAPVNGAYYADQVPALEHGLSAGAGGPGGGFPSTGNAALANLAAAIANRNNARCDIVVIGDSITEGYRATAFTSRWIAQANRAVRAACPTTANGAGGGLGFIPIQNSGGLTSFTWPVANTAGTPGSALLGPVRFSTACTTAGTTWTYTAPAGTTSVKIMYYDSVTAGSFSWQVNSGPVTTVSNAGAADDIFTSAITMAAGDVLTIAYVSGEIWLDGLMHYAGDETSGITFNGCGHYGWSLPNWMQAGTGQNWYPGFSAFTPAAFAVMLGVNDAQSTGGNETAAQFQSNLAAFVADIRADAIGMTKTPVILIAGYEPNETTVDAGGWAAYVAAMRAVAAADTVGAAVIDLNYRMPSVASAWDNGALYADTWHPADLGCALIGEIAAAAVRVA